MSRRRTVNMAKRPQIRLAFHELRTWIRPAMYVPLESLGMLLSLGIGTLYHDLA